MSLYYTTSLYINLQQFSKHYSLKKWGQLMTAETIGTQLVWACYRRETDEEKSVDFFSSITTSIDGMSSISLVSDRLTNSFFCFRFYFSYRPIDIVGNTHR